jgi:predicted NAD-dependent protein-ADP-ribosyltransferase YbiA (DUF1768 family)
VNPLEAEVINTVESLEDENITDLNPNKLFEYKANKAGKKSIQFFSKSADANVRYLSNFYHSGIPLDIDGKLYPTVEHYYQSQKAEIMGLPELAEKIRQIPADQPLQAKKLGGAPSFREAYANKYGGSKSSALTKDKVKELYNLKVTNNILDEIMLKALRVKFSQPEMKAKLIKTGDSWIGETRRRMGGDWEITASGDPGRLGILIMKVRDSTYGKV